MEAHFQLTDTEFEQQFASGLFDPALFSHEAHLRLAWIHIHRYGVNSAIEHVTSQLLAYVQQLGAEAKFNQTLTVAAVKAVYHFMLQSSAQCFGDFIAAHPRLKYNFKELIAFHYGFDIYTLAEAKIQYLEPDLLPFDI